MNLRAHFERQAFLSDFWTKNVSTTIRRLYAELVQLSEDEFWLMGGLSPGYDEYFQSTELCSPSSG